MSSFLTKMLHNVWLRRFVWLIVLTSIAVGVKFWFFPTKKEDRFITAPVTRMDLEESVLATGTVKAYRQVSVGAQVSGQIKNLNVVLGQKVRQGDLLAVIDPDRQENALQSAQAELAGNRATLVSKQALLYKAKLDFERQTIMIKDGATSKEAYDNAKAALELAKADIGLAKSQIERSEINVETAKVSLGYTQVIAPIDGIVVSVPVEEGQTVNANQTTPTILVLAQLDKVTIKAEISEGDVIKLKEGMPASFTILGDSFRRYTTTLRSIDPGPTTLTDRDNSMGTGSASGPGVTSNEPIYYYGMMDVPNPEGRLRISMTTQITIVIKNIKGVLSIPSLALGRQNQNGEYAVLVLTKENVIEERWVKAGLNNNINAEILSGLVENEQVILSQTEEGSGSQNTAAAKAMSHRRMGAAVGGR
jgi:macrolide-specific efflux system membrane fusion protein